MMRAWVNGAPKSGTHALVKACELLGVPATHHHEPYREGLAIDGQPLLVMRDPRNVAISWVRHHGRPVTEGTVMAALRQFVHGSLPEDLQAYEPWLTRAYVVRFESLVQSAETMRDLSRLLGSGADPDAAFAWLPGGTLTWTGRLSDWATVWTPAIDRVWQELGGPALLARWGYV
jgi:hypothetical protein